MAARTQTKTDKPTELVFGRIDKGHITLGILGTTPFIANRVSEKARRDLLLPSGRKTAADKAAKLKHDPYAEYQASPYRLTAPTAPTLLGVPAAAFKAAMCTAALDLPGTNKTQIGRLVDVQGMLLPLYGAPQLLMSIVRNADQAHTPDVRTRAILPEWAVIITVEFVTPLIKEASIVNLVHAGGMTAGVGDWRREKGKGNFGQFEVVSHTDPRLLAVMERGDRTAQQRGLAEPQAFDYDTEDLLTWYQSEYLRRIGTPVDTGNGGDEEVEEQELEVLV